MHQHALGTAKTVPNSEPDPRTTPVVLLLFRSHQVDLAATFWNYVCPLRKTGLGRFNSSLNGLWRFDSRILRRSFAVTYGFNGSFRPTNPIDGFFGFQLFYP